MEPLTLIERMKAALAAFSSSGAAKGDMQTVSVGGLETESITSQLTRLSPKKLASILNDADNGDIIGQHRLFEDVEDSDEHVFTELSKRRRALLSLDWEILPAVTSDAAAAKKAAAYAEVVKGLFDAIPDFEDLILDLGDAIGHGFAPLEIEWGYDGKYHAPQALHLRPQHWFCLGREARDLRLASPTEPDGFELEPLGWIIHQHRSKSGWFSRYGLFRVIMSSFILKQYARTGFAQFLEIHGLPLRVGKYPVGSSNKEKSLLLAGLQALGRDAACIIPDGMLLEFIEPVKASESPFTAMIDHCDRGISKAILGGTLTTQADGKTSTNALGMVHNEVRRDLLVSDAVQVASTITRQLLLPLAVINCGLEDTRLAPWFRFDTTEPEDLQKLAEALPKLVQVMDIPAAWAHEKTRIPLAKEGEPVLQMRFAGQTAADESEKDQPEKEKSQKKDAEKEKPIRDTPVKAQVSLAAQAESSVAKPYPQATQGLPGALYDAAQAQLDVAMSTADSGLQEQMSVLLAPLLAEVQEGLPPDALMARLAELYPLLDDAALQEQMARVFFVSELWGRVTAASE